MNISIYMQKKNILVTGANGQLGRCIQDSSASRQDAYSFFFTDIDTLDITNYNAAALMIMLMSFSLTKSLTAL